MRIVETITTDDDYRQTLTIEVDGKGIFGVGDGEPEDSNLSRDFSDCFSITDLMKMAYDAGKNGEDWEYELIEENED
jgi:hypothetical protein